MKCWIGGERWLSTELLARAVGPTGVVYAQDSRRVIERFVKTVRHPCQKPS